MLSPRAGAFALFLSAFLGASGAAATDASEVENVRPVGILAWNDSVLLLAELNPCGTSADNDLGGRFCPFAGEIFVSRDGGRSWEKRIAADAGYFEWFLATPTQLWMAGSHVQEAPGQAKMQSVALADDVPLPGLPVVAADAKRT